MSSRALGFRQGTQTCWALAFSLVKVRGWTRLYLRPPPRSWNVVFLIPSQGQEVLRGRKNKAIPGAKSRNWTIQHVNLLKIEPESVVPRIECFHTIFQKMRPDKFGGSVTRRMHSLRELGRTYGANMAPATTNSSSSFWLTWWVKKMISL